MLNAEESAAKERLRFRVPSFDPCLFVVFRKEGRAVGAFSTHFDDVLGCGEVACPDKIRVFSEYRFREMGAQESPFAHGAWECPGRRFLV